MFSWLIFSAKYLIFFLSVPLIYFWVKGRRSLVWRALLSCVLAEIGTFLIGFCFPTPRPFEVFGISPPSVFIWGVRTSSFPSGHTAVGVALAVAVMLQEKLLGRFLLLLALAVGVARFLVLAHFWWDIVGGAVLGTLCALLVSRIFLKRQLQLKGTDPQK